MVRNRRAADIMKTISSHTLGCKVNQYDTQAMIERFEAAGYVRVPFGAPADICLVNTCTVTATGESKSLKAIRRVHKDSPNADIIAAGCLAQMDAKRVSALNGVRLAIGTQRRARVVELYERAVREKAVLIAVAGLEGAEFERLCVSRHEGRIRALMKIQEGCDRHCSYCTVPGARGHSRSMPLIDVRAEASRLAGEGYREIALAGIDLSSYGAGIGLRLTDAIQAVHETSGTARIRLGSLEPPAADGEFITAAAALPKLCRHFHLSLQSGSDEVLRRMRRPYTSEGYARIAGDILKAMPDASLTTDIICGFPGETENDVNKTLKFVEEIGFSRIHVFPFSRRDSTDAAKMPFQIGSKAIKERVLQFIELGNKLEARYANRMIGSTVEALFEEFSGGAAEGYTRQYARVRADGQPGMLADVIIDSAEGALAVGHIAGREG
jgi:threonylcarbamoyladenosine tRNA methylthiotransferase MtaB